MIRLRANNDTEDLNNYHSNNNSVFKQNLRISIDRLNLSGAEATIDGLHELLSEKSVSSTNTGRRSRSGILNKSERKRTYRFFHGRTISLLYTAYKTTDPSGHTSLFLCTSLVNR